MTRAALRQLVKAANVAARSAGQFGTPEWTDAYQRVLDQAGHAHLLAPRPCTSA